MNTIEKLESAVMQLSSEQYYVFRSWMKDYENEMWDKEMVEDAESGQLDSLADEALIDLKNGRCTDL